MWTAKKKTNMRIRKMACFPNVEGDIFYETFVWRSSYLRLTSYLHLPGTPNNHYLMDGNGETTISHVKICNYPLETTIKK